MKMYVISNWTLIKIWNISRDASSSQLSNSLFSCSCKYFGHTELEPFQVKRIQYFAK